MAGALVAAEPVSIYDKYREPADKLIAAALEDFGNLRFKQGRFEEALDLFRRAGEIIKTRQEAGDPVRPDAGVLPRTQGAVFRWIAETGFDQRLKWRNDFLQAHQRAAKT